MSSRNNLKLCQLQAKRTFKAKCGHVVRRGECYAVADDYFNGRRYHTSQCQTCHDAEIAEAMHVRETVQQLGRMGVERPLALPRPS